MRKVSDLVAEFECMGFSASYACRKVDEYLDEFLGAENRSEMMDFEEISKEAYRYVFDNFLNDELENLVAECGGELDDI